MFRSNREGDEGLFWQNADGTGPAERLARADRDSSLQPEAWTRDGKTLILSVSRLAGGDRSLATFRVGIDKAPQPLIPVYSSNSALSPDNRWLAYFFNTAGRIGIFVQPYPPTGAKYQLPGDDLRDPIWSPDGKQLLYAAADGTSWQLMAIPVQTTPVFSFGAPAATAIKGFISTGARNYDLSPDGKQLAIIVPESGSDSSTSGAEPMHVVLNWFEELKARVPIK